MAGEVVHVEFPSEDPDRAQRFWCGLFGWSFGDSVMPDMDYRMARTSETSGVAIYSGGTYATGIPKFYFARTTSTPVREGARARRYRSEAKARCPTHGWFAACTGQRGQRVLTLADRSRGLRRALRGRRRRARRPRTPGAPGTDTSALGHRFSYGAGHMGGPKGGEPHVPALPKTLVTLAATAALAGGAVAHAATARRHG